jgi:hypothetical protein
MGTVLRFPKVRRPRKRASTGEQGSSAVVVILPVIRIERKGSPRRPRASRS